MNISETIVLSVISGIATSALIFICLNIFNKILMPWYRKTIYRGLDIGGSWICTQEHSLATDTIKLNIIQNEQKISGTIIVIKTHKDEERVETKILEIKGTFQDGHLMLIGNSKDKRVRSHMTYLANIVSGGLKLDGMYSLVDAANGNIRSINAIFSRENA